jgi:DNA-binding SARP family transcriptional activator/tetratricopeptide (TPR) repeat protein
MTDATSGPTLQLGSTLRLLLPGGDVQVLAGTSALLAARLALAGPQARREIAPLLWPDVGERRARANLRQSLLRLKAQAGCDWIVGETELRLAGDVVVDAEGPGELLAGLDAALPSDELRAWLEGARRQRLQRRRAALVATAEAAEAAQDWPAAQAAAESLLELEPHSEEAHRRRIRLHYLQGDTGRAAAAVAECERMLRREFGAAPSEATRTLIALVARAGPPPRPETDGLRAASQALALPLHAAALLRPPRMVGRHAEHAALHAAARSGGPALVVGEAGMGKSRLLAELAAAWPREQVAAVKAQVGDAGVPYATLARLLHGACRLRGVPVPPLVPAQGAPEAGAWRLQLQQAVAATLATLGVALVLVDDLHFADPASLETVQALATALDLGAAAGAEAHPVAGAAANAVGKAAPGPSAWVMAMRPAEAGSAARTLADALAEWPQAPRIALAPLSTAQVAELLVEVGLGPAQATSLAPALARHTGGNPLFVLETLRGMPLGHLATGEGAARLPQPAGVGALIERRLRQLSPGALALARAAAIAGPDFSPALAEAVLARPALDLADAWAELESAQVLREMAFAHDLVFETTLAGIPKPIARHLHGAVAQWLEGQGGEAAPVAAHWLEAGAPAKALPALRTAAARSMQAWRPREAAGFLARAWETCAAQLDPGAPRLDLLLAWEEAECASAGPQAALAVLDRIEPGGLDAAHRLRLLARRASLCGDARRFDDAVRVGQEAIELAARLGDTPQLADALASAGTAMAMRGEAEQAEALCLRWWPRVVDLDPAPGRLFAARAIVLDRLGRVEAAEGLHRRAWVALSAQGQTAEAVMVLNNLSTHLSLRGRVAEADEQAAAAERMQAQHDQLSDTLVLIQLRRAVNARDLGQFGTALQRFEQTLAALPDQDGTMRRWALVLRAVLWQQIGQRARAWQDLRAADAATLPPFARVPAGLLALELAGDDPQAAQAALAEAEQVCAEGSEPFHGLRVQAERCRREALQHGIDAEAARSSLAQLLERANDRGAEGLRASLHLLGTQALLALGATAPAREWLLACSTLPAAITPRHPAGVWWHGLWRAWLALGDADRAAAAHAEGVAWIHRTLQQHLPREFHAGFRQVPEHQALLRG